MYISPCTTRICIIYMLYAVWILHTYAATLLVFERSVLLVAAQIVNMMTILIQRSENRYNCLLWRGFHHLKKHWGERVQL
jgi:hypothetical protein